MRWLAQYFTSNELGPHDLLSEQVVALLRADAKLLQLFNGRIERMDHAVFADMREVPRLQVVHDFERETPMAGSEQVSVELVVLVRYQANDVQPLEPGEPSIQTLCRYIKKVLKSDKHLNREYVVSGTARRVQLAKRVDFEDLPPTEIRDQNGALQHWMKPIRLRYTAAIEPDTDQIWNVALAVASNN